MKDHFDTLIYLVVGVIYLMIKNARSGNDDKKTVVDKPLEYQPAPKTRTNWANTWEDKASKAPAARKNLSQTVTEKASLYATQRTTPQLASQQPPSKKIDRVLRRYSSWKKAVIMIELFHPRA
jgi:secreted Zn-dependent insulinase-like peptidase